MKNRLIEIAEQLRFVYQKAAECNIAKRQYDSNIADLKLALTPDDGWPGKNETERKVTMEKTLGADPEMKKILTDLMECERDIDNIEAERNALEAERRAVEWTIRDTFSPHRTLDDILDERSVDEGVF